MAVIIMGDSPINRAAYGNRDSTELTLGNPAPKDGLITSVSVYLYQASPDLYLGLFYKSGTNKYTCRSAAHPGAVAIGLQTITVSLAVKAGDFIGYHHEGATGRTDRDNSGFTGIAMANDSNNHCSPGDESLYTDYSGYALSIQGSGASTATRGWWK
jgi:hypothetical protein